MAYAESTTVPVEKTRAEIERLLVKFKCTQFVVGSDNEAHTAMVQFKAQNRIIRFLVQHGARIDARNKAGQTPLDAAFAHRDRANTLIRTGPVALLRELMGLPAIAGGPR